MAVAAEQTSQLLKAFRSKLPETTESEFCWDEVESELQTTLRAVREKKLAKQYRVPASQRSASEEVTQLTVASDASASLVVGSETSDVENLRVLLQSSSMGDQEPMGAELGGHPA